MDIDPEAHQESSNISLKDNFRDELVFIEKFPGDTAGAVTSSAAGEDFGHYSQRIDAEEDNPYKPFTSKIEWEIARWAKLNDIGSNALTKLLSIDGVS